MTGAVVVGVGVFVLISVVVMVVGIICCYR